MTVLLVLAFFAALITTDYLVTRHRLARDARSLANAAVPAVEPRGSPAIRCRKRSTTTVGTPGPARSTPTPSSSASTTSPDA